LLPVRRPVCILFLAIYLLSATEAHQLLKVPVMVSHFSEHKKENTNINFISFIVLHYLSGNVKDSDYERDMQLPFKDSDNCLVSSNPVTVPLFEIIIADPDHADLLSNFVLQNDCSLPSAFKGAVFQPPRIC